MVACDSSDIRKEYNILVNELKKYNPDLLDKRRILAITKSDMLDEILMEQMKELLPEGIPTIFISSVAQYNIDQLKDMIWMQINAD
jgi:GTP-binding protein